MSIPSIRYDDLQYRIKKLERIIFLKQFNTIWFTIWWNYWPGTKIKVRWPSGNIVVDHNHPQWQDMGGAVRVDLGYSADPNDHYRSELEEKVGKQSIHWNWNLEGSDIENNQLTIKISKNKAKWASYFALKWS